MTLLHIACHHQASSIKFATALWLSLSESVSFAPSVFISISVIYSIVCAVSPTALLSTLCHLSD